MNTISKDAYFAQAVKLFGKDSKKWRFVCVSCRTEQGYEEFSRYAPRLCADDVYAYIGFSCIGRWTKEMGCSHTLGGALQMHTLEVKDGDFTYKRFEFAKPLKFEDLAAGEDHG